MRCPSYRPYWNAMSQGLSTLAFGPTVTKSALLCSFATALRPKRMHRRARIAKKWKKRYGMVMSECNGRDKDGLRAYEMAGMGIVACPHAYELISKALRP